MTLDTKRPEFSTSIPTAENPQEINEVVSGLAEYYRSMFVANRIPLTPPEIDSFKIGTPKQHEDDKRWVYKQREKDNIRGSEIGIMLERMFQMETSRSGWFGAPAFFRTTEFDDRHGVDGVLEWKTAGGMVYRLGVDVTGDTDMSKLLQKMKRQNGLVDVKYFRSAFLAEGDRLTEGPIHVPLVILGIKDKYLPALHADLARKIGSLKNHWVEFAFLIEADQQLRAMRERAARLNKDFCETVDIVYQMIDAIFENKKREPAYARLSTMKEVPFSSPLLIPEGFGSESRH